MAQDKIELLTSYNNSGFCLFPLVGKVPAKGQKAWQDTPYDLGIDPEKFPENFAVVLGLDILVIDVDPRNFDQSDKPHKRLFDDISVSLSELNTYVVQTGTGGLHIYMRIPPGTAIKKKNSKYKGIDFLGKGCYVVGAGSIHPDTGKPYVVLRGTPEEIKDAPETLLEIIRQTMDTTAHVVGRDFTDAKYDVDRFIQLCKEAPEAITGEGGDTQTYKIACQGRNLALSPGLAYQVMLEHYNPRCLPPWTPEELMIKVKNGYTFAQGEVGKDTPERTFKVEKGEFTHITWDKTSNGTVKRTLKNVCNYFEIPYSEVHATVAFDEFSKRVILIKPLPWMKDKHIKDYQEWSPHDSIQFRYYLNTKGFDAPIKLIDEAIVKVSLDTSFHPVKDYMTKLVWDGTPRLDTWLTYYLGVEDNDYTREVGKIALMQMVKRVYQPGCKADYILVLEGEQGSKKSEVFRVLARPWFAEFPCDPHSKETVDLMQGKLIIEFAEMEVTRRADVDALKAFITRQVDRIRFAYASKSVDVPRQCVFMGTKNPDATNEYFADTTGNRRFFPVRIGAINIADLQLDRDQLVAEAVQLVMKGVASWIINESVLKMAEAEQEARQYTDPWTGQIEDFLDLDEIAVKYFFTTTKDIWTSSVGLKGNAAQMTRFHSTRIHTVMRNLGWIYGTYSHPLKKKPTKSFKYVVDPLIENAGGLFE